MRHSWWEGWTEAPNYKHHSVRLMVVVLIQPIRGQYCQVWPMGGGPVLLMVMWPILPWPSISLVTRQALAMAEADTCDEKLMISPGSCLCLQPPLSEETHHHRQPDLHLWLVSRLGPDIFSGLSVFVVSGVDGCLTLVCDDSSPWREARRGLNVSFECFLWFVSSLGWPEEKTEQCKTRGH